MPPQILENRFKLGTIIDEGGMGVVYNGIVISLKNKRVAKRVAIKLIRKELVDDETLLKRFRQEVETQSKLHHPNILPILDANLDIFKTRNRNPGTLFFIVLEYAHFGDLEKRLKAKGITLKRRFNWAQQIADAIAFTHSNKIVHRDLKPNNILFVHQDTPKISDFGLCLSFEESEILTLSYQKLGAPAFMSPEQWISSKSADYQSDIYSLGLLYYFLFNNTALLLKDSFLMVERRKFKVRIPDLESYKETDESIDRIIKKMIQPLPQNRYKTMNEVIKDLRKIKL